MAPGHDDGTTLSMEIAAEAGKMTCCKNAMKASQANCVDVSLRLRVRRREKWATGMWMESKPAVSVNRTSLSPRHWRSGRSPSTDIQNATDLALNKRGSDEAAGHRGVDVAKLQAGDINKSRTNSKFDALMAHLVDNKPSS